MRILTINTSSYYYFTHGVGHFVCVGGCLFRGGLGFKLFQTISPNYLSQVSHGAYLFIQGFLLEVDSA